MAAGLFLALSDMHSLRPCGEAGREVKVLK